jgi:uncharacterized protein (DUF736 family)
MTEYDNANRGALFENPNKKEEKHPDFTGPLNIRGSDDWEMAAWKRTSKSGKSYLSVKVSLKKYDQLDKDIESHAEKWSKKKPDKDIPF